MSGEGKVVCVTGGSGYIASWLVKLLLHHGYTVKATIRDLNDPKKTEHLLGLEGAKERLHLVKADLVEDGSFDSAVDGCEGVFHTACPLYHINDAQPLYLLAKTLAEQAAWKYAKENGIDIVTLHPGFTIGPYLQPTISTTVDVILKYIKGETFPNQIYRLVDVRDVALAHIKAFELPSANGRYCLVERVVHFSDILKIVHEKYPTLHIPGKCEDEKPVMEKYDVSREKAKTLGLNFIPLEKSVEDTIECLMEKGFISV